MRWRPSEVDPAAVERRPEDYYLFVLGSGGHTKEMLMMMDDGFCDFNRVHRRYLISTGDTMSKNHALHYEKELGELCAKDDKDPGAYDIRTVTRARKVHQPLITTPASALRCFSEIFEILLTPPEGEVGQLVQFPRIVFSNGPATGFIAALAVYILKAFYVVPEDRMCFVYIESWARISTLSLTGRLIWKMGLADAFAVQHEEVAKKYKVEFAGPLVFNSRRPEAEGS